TTGGERASSARHCPKQPTGEDALLALYFIPGSTKLALEIRVGLAQLVYLRRRLVQVLLDLNQLVVLLDQVLVFPAQILILLGEIFVLPAKVLILPGQLVTLGANLLVFPT